MRAPPANDDMVRPLSPVYTIVAAAPAQNGGGKEIGRAVAEDNHDVLSVTSSCTSGSVFRLEDLEEDSDDDEDYEELQGRRRRRQQGTPGTARNTTCRKRGRVNKGKKSRYRRVYEPEVKVYVHYRDEDVLCQRGGLSNGHPGNMMYLKAKQELQPKYYAATKAKKTDVSQELVDRVHAWGGQFLKKDYNRNAGEVHNHAARTKVGQALREEYTPEKGAAKRSRYAKKK